MQIKGRLLISIFGAFWGAFQFGWNTGVINNPEGVIKSFINDSEVRRSSVVPEKWRVDMLWSVIVAMFAAGGVFGGLLAGWWADKIGRLRGMQVNACLGLVAAALMGLAKVVDLYELIVVGRIVIGFCSAMCTALTPLYLTEVAPQHLRGAVGVVNQFGVVVGILLAQILSVDQVLGTDRWWPLLLAMCAVPALAQILVLLCCPESPRFLLLVRGEKENAAKALALLRSDKDALAEELREMEEQHVREQLEEKVTCLQLFSSRKYLLPLFIGVVLHLTQQFSGINVIFYYSKNVMVDVGLSEDIAQYTTIAVGAIMVIMTVVSIPLMDRAGRRILHLGGLAGVFICSIIFTIAFSLKSNSSALKWVAVIFLLLFVVCFAIGPGSIPWMMMSEMFAQGARPNAIAVGVAVNWIANLIVAQTTPALQKALTTFLFVPYTVFLLIAGIFLFFFMPETKNRSFEEIARSFQPSAANYESMAGSKKLQNDAPAARYTPKYDSIHVSET